MPDQHQQPRTELSDLVRETRAKRRLSVRAIEELTLDPTTGAPVISRGWLGRLERSQSPAVPREEELRALARVLELSYHEVAAAAGAQFWGHRTVWSPSGRVRAHLRADEQMDPVIAEHLARLMERFAELDSDAP